MSDPSALLNDLSEEAVWRLEDICCRFEQSWQASQRPRPEDYLGAAAGVERLAVLRELLRLDVHYRRRAGEGPCARDYATQFPDATDLLSEMFPNFPEGSELSSASSAEVTIDAAERTGPHFGAMRSGTRNAALDAEERPCKDPASSPGAPSASRFRVLRFHAAGGLGEVFVAEDVELHREVALKEIKRAYAGQGESRERFVLEAEITGNLEHPGIVPVYGLGAYPDGRPFYAMRFIRGDTLEAAIDRFHGQAPVRFDSLELRQLLGRLVAVCQAVAFAHSRGVLHRDLKPANVMLGKFGETLVVDWGLAKVVGRAETSEPGPGEGLLRPLGGGAQATVGVVGTPAFMSPEQAAGKVEELSAATDTYSLGATMYALLTNRAPFKGSVGEVVKQVECGAWVAPLQVNGSVPAALDAICRKAMALRPEDRYGSAQALAEDVEHFLADEPVEAYAEPAGARLRRWMRKRPRRVTAAGVLLVTAVVGLTVGTVLLERSNREARENLAMVEGQANFFLVEVSEDLLLNEPGMQPLRQSLLLKVLDDYSAFLKKRPGNPHARHQMAEAKRQLGELNVQAGRMEEARALEVQAVELYEGLLQGVPADRGLRFGLARARHVLADLEVQSFDPGEGKKQIERAIELLEVLKADEPGNADYLIMLARSYDLRARAEGQQGSTDSGLAHNKQVLEVLLEADSRMPGNDRTNGSATKIMWMIGHFTSLYPHTWPRVLMLGRACTNQGILLSLAGRNGEAVRMLEEAAAVYRLLVEQNSRAGQFRHGLALALLHAGRVKCELGLPVRAEPSLREALGLLRHLVQDDPHVKEYRATRLLAAGYLGEALFRQGRTVAAAELLREAETAGEDVLGGPSKNRELQRQHARLLHVLGCLECATGDLDRSLAVCLKSHEKLEQALRERPGDRSLRCDWLANRETLARSRLLKGNLSRAGWIAEQQRILEERKHLAEQGPPSPRFQGEVAGSSAVLATLLLGTGRQTEALACIDSVLPAHEKLVQAEQDRVKAAVREQEEAGQLPDRPGRQNSLQLFMQNIPIVPDNSLYRQWALLHARRGAALARVGRGAEAGEAVRRAVGITRSLLSGGPPFPRPQGSLPSLGSFIAKLPWRLEPCYLDDLACHLALAATLPREAVQPDPADSAMRALRCFVASGFDNPHKLRTDPALEPLRQREDFQMLVRDLEDAGSGRKASSKNP